MEQEHRSRAYHSYNDPSKSRTNGPGNVEANPTQGDRVRKFPAGDQSRHDGLPDRLGQGGPETEHKGQHQEAPGRRRTQERQNTQDADSHQHYGEPNQQQPAAVKQGRPGTRMKTQEGTPAARG